MGRRDDGRLFGRFDGSIIHAGSFSKHDTAAPAPRACALAELDGADSLWNRAAETARQADAFCCRTEWQLSFHETFAPRRPLWIREAEGSAVALAARQHPGVGVLLEPLESHWLFGCPLVGPGATSVLRALLAEEPLRSLSPSVLVSGLFPRAELSRRIRRTFAATHEVLRVAPEVLCSASLEGGLDGYLSRRSARLRKRLRQAARRAALAGVRFERCRPDGVAEADAAYRRMLAVERASWKGIGRCGMAERGSREFYGRMLRRLSLSRAARVTFARCDEEDVGFIFGAVAGPRYRGQQFSFVEAFRPYSIGNLLQLEQIRWLCEESVLHYDMGPRMEYKAHWTEHEIRIHSLLLRPSKGG